MTLAIYFALVGEGSTEEGLISVLQQLCLRHGASEVIGRCPKVSKVPRITKKQGGASTPLGEKVRRALKLEPRTNLLFVHRDADSPTADRRYQEIQKAVQGVTLPYVAVVPIQETEAWLLLDEAAIRQVAGRSSGRVPLNLPSLHQVEATAKPKERLQEALAAASQLSGQRLKQFRSNFSVQRRLLLGNLDVEGSIQHLPAWQRLNADLQAAIDSLKGAEEHAP